MKYGNKRLEAIALFRQHCRERIAAGASTTETLNDLRTAMHSLVQEFCVEHGVPGVNYWHHPESDSYFAQLPGEPLGDGPDVELLCPLKRYEFLSRQGLHFGYDDRL